jgi:hypothetical protein
MTAAEKAKELVDKYSTTIGTSDFHIPKFISGIPCADGSPEYSKLLEEETTQLAKEQALICVDEILAELPDWKDATADDNDLVYEWEEKRITYWKSVKTEIQKL